MTVLDEFHFRWLGNSVIEIGKAGSFEVSFDFEPSKMKPF